MNIVRLWYSTNSNALFLLLLVLMGGFVIETLNCDIQYHLTHNRILKSINSINASIYISLVITNKKPLKIH